MPELVYLPPAGDTVTEGRIMRWEKNEGDNVKKGETICDIMTSKLSIEISVENDGKIFKIFAPVDEKVPVGKVIAVLQLEGETITEDDINKITDRYISETVESTTEEENKTKEKMDKTSNDSAVKADRVRISPIAKKLAAELDVDITKVIGTGPDGRIQKEDILNYNENQKISSDTKQEEKAVEKMSEIRNIIAWRLRESVTTKPHINFQTQVRMDELLNMRNTINKNIENKISINSFIILATVKSLKKYKYINVNLLGDEIVLYNDINIGMAVARESKGLIVPVIKRANKMSLSEIDIEAKKLTELAKEDNLSMDQITGGTFTVSNLGMYGIENFNAIINPPEVGIMAASSIIKKPVIIDEDIISASIMNINVAVDHSVVDGAMASEFIMEVKRFLEEPYLMFI
jgi:pyruvate dehydrogenase E2 component (dihydrolipoamide acetyltransferase)